MQERFLGRVEPDMDVCDINGDKVGTVNHVYRHQLTPTATDATPAAPPPEEFIEVKTGFLVFGKHYYVPMSSVQDVTQGCVFLSHPKEDFQRLGWEDKPLQLNDLS
jgi:hypothetical protein